jgi:hypothetical protein
VGGETGHHAVGSDASTRRTRPEKKRLAADVGRRDEAMKHRSSARRSRAKAAAKPVDRMLRKTEEEITAAKALLKKEKTRAKLAKRKLARDNAKRAAKLIKKTKESIEDHQELLAQQKSKSKRKSR